jgi:hypothetical protein
VAAGAGAGGGTGAGVAASAGVGVDADLYGDEDGSMQGTDADSALSSSASGFGVGGR